MAEPEREKQVIVRRSLNDAEKGLVPRGIMVSEKLAQTAMAYFGVESLNDLTLDHIRRYNDALKKLADTALEFAGAAEATPLQTKEDASKESERLVRAS